MVVPINGGEVKINALTCMNVKFFLVCLFLPSETNNNPQDRFSTPVVTIVVLPRHPRHN